jgi:phosphoglucosamine mutase
MTRRLFGTDGIRGRANEEPVTASTLLTVAMAAGAHFANGANRGLAVIGKDTRLSGYLLEPALTAGFISVGMDVVLLGPLPTPAVGLLTRSLRADLGVMISASHNPHHDNGIKLFGPDGYKLSDAAERSIEDRVRCGSTANLAPPNSLGRANRLDDATGRYIEFAKATFPRSLRLEGLKVVVDCANGAAYKVAPRILFELGAEVITLSAQPDGININHDCGTTAPANLQKAVLRHGADLGIALDGDADRVIMADEKGRLVDGDQILAVVGASWKRAGRLPGDAIVGTVMSNLGLERYLASQGLDFVRTPVGDHHVIEHMRRNGFSVGGEQSGHIILTDYITTGDGLIAALQVLAVLAGTGKLAGELLRPYDPVPQIVESVPMNGGSPLEQPRVRSAIREGEAALDRSGRLLIRKSGTEPVIRIMAEGEDEALVSNVVAHVAKAIEQVT